jgi:hypothetical protein
MSKKIIMFCALAFVVAFAASAYAEVQNVRVGGDITILGIYRDEYDLDDRAGSDTSDDVAFYANIARVKIDADLTDNVQATIRLLNERDWDQEDSADTDIDLDLAYITLKEFLYSPLTLTLGRQNLRFGTGMIVGDPDTNAQTSAGSGLNGSLAEDLSARKAFDALRATLDYAPWTIDLIAAKIDETEQTGAATTGEDEDLLGVNVAYKFAFYNALAEGYFFAKDADTEVAIAAATPGTIQQPSGDIYNLGARGSVEPVKGLNLSGEIAHQFGEARRSAGTSRDQKAWAYDLDGTYTWENAYMPTLGIGYSFRSGEEVANTGDYEAWNPMYEDQTQGIVADYLLAGVNAGVSSNARIIKLYGSIKPTRDITLAAKYYNFTLDEKLVTSNDTLVTYPVAGTGIASRSFRMNTDDDLGDEIDLIATYDYTEDVQFALAYGLFRPGGALDGRVGGVKVNDDDATSLVGSVRVVF